MSEQIDKTEKETHAYATRKSVAYSNNFHSMQAKEASNKIYILLP